MQRPVAEQPAEKTADQREQDHLGEELAGQAREAGAEGMAGRELAQARVRANQHEVCDIHGPDREHEQHATPQKKQRGPNLTNEVVVERRHHGVEAGVDEDLFHGWEALEVTGVERIHLLFRLLDRSPRLQPSNHRPVVAVPRIV